MKIELTEEEATVLVNLLGVALKSPAIDLQATFNAAESALYFVRKIKAAQDEKLVKSPDNDKDSSLDSRIEA